MASCLRHSQREENALMKRATMGILAGMVGSALAVWWTRRHRSGLPSEDYSRMAEGII
jgi:hypothetical protein